MNRSRRRPLFALATVLVGVIGASACSSGAPSTKRALQDVIESLEDVTPEAKDCMLTQLDKYSNSDLDDIGENNDEDALQLDVEGNLRSGTEALSDFGAVMRKCVTDNPVAGSVGSEPPSSGPLGTDVPGSGAPIGTDAPEGTEAG